MQLIERRSVAGADAAGLDEWDAFRLEIREALASVRRHAFGIGIAVLAAIALALPVLVLRSPTYVGTVQVLLDPRGLNVVSNEIVPQPPSADVNDAVIETQSRFLRYDAVLREVVRTLHLTEDPAYAPQPGLGSRIKGVIGLGTAPAADPVDVATRILGKATTFQRDGKSFVVSLSVRANDPEKAARIATAMGQAFVDDIEHRRRDVVVRARDAVGATLKQQSAHVIAAEQAVESYKREIGVVDQDGRALNTAKMTELNSQLLVARAQTRALAAKIATFDATGPAGAEGTDAVESTALSQMRVNLAEVLRQQENLRATLGPRHPAAVEVDAQCAA